VGDVRADLHVHTTASDGTFSPTEVVEHAINIGLDVIAITDHDSVEGCGSALAAAAERDIRVIPGVELSCSVDGRDVHTLGYFIRFRDPVFIEHLLRLRRDRLERAFEMVEILKEDGYAITLEAVLQLAGGGSLGRSHIARALVDSGHVNSVQDAFDNLIGREGPYFVGKKLSSPEQAIEIIRDAGGIAVLAHPGISGISDLIPELARDGLAGIEAFHGEHTAEQKSHFYEMANELGLLATGGSDFHSTDGPGPGLGNIDIPVEAVLQFLRAEP